MKDVKTQITELEALRRERHGAGLTSRLHRGIDYAGAGMLVDAARAALDEGIPNQQRMRVRKALELLREGYYDLFQWAEANGYYDVRPNAEDREEAAFRMDPGEPL